MGIFSGIKSALVEEVVDCQSEVPQDDYNLYEETISNVELDDVRVDTLISDIYDQNGLSEMDKSIFKVEEVINSLPKEMSTATKKTTVLSILSSFELTPDEISLDGNQRIDVLIDILKKIISDNEALVFDKKQLIEEHKKQIEELEKEIATNQEETKCSDEKIRTEIERIKGLVEFIGGNE